MENARTLLAGAGIGAGIVYLLDPQMGRRRVARVKDKATMILSRSDDAVEMTARDLANRVKGLGAEVAHLFRTDDASDDVIEARVRSRLGRVVSHPSSISVSCESGRCRLRGPILQVELDRCLREVARTRGVVEVVNEMDVYKEPSDVPGLQGGVRRREPRFELMQSNWSPAARLLMGGLGAGMLTWCMRERTPAATVAGYVGFGLLARSVSNVETARLFGLNRSRRAVEVHKIINVYAPIEEVYRIWTQYENFPKFMPHIREVRDLGGDRSHWVAHAAPGVNVEWDAIVTREVPNHELSWRSEPGALAPNAGVVRFEENADGSTRVNLRIQYNPPAGAFAHAVLRAFGADLRSKLDDDLVRFKSLLETGKTTVHGHTVHTEEIA